jgi:23S rRNA (uracil-5-)-methyltransferase RumA
MEAAIITSLGQHGEGRGTRKGKPLFIPLALPREEISYHVLKENAHYTLGSLEQILKPSEDRITPRCPYFGQCGGCHLMHLKKAAQLIEKQKLVQQAASHYPTLKQSVVMACIPSPEQDHWRAKSQLPTEIRGNKLVWGLYKVDSHEIVPITACYVHATPAEEVLGALRITLEETPLPQEVLEGKSHFRFLHLRTSLTQNACILTFITDGVSEKYLTKVAERLSTITDRLVGVFHLVNTSDNNTVIQGTPHLIYGSRFLEERLHIGEEFFDFQITPDAFFQVNPQQAEALINYAIQQIDPKPSDTLLDAYCGVGTIAIPLAKNVLKYGVLNIAKAL